MCIPSMVGYFSSGRIGSNAELGIQSNAMKKISLLNNSEQLAANYADNIFQKDRHNPEAFISGLAQLNEADKDLNAGLIMGDLMRNIMNSIEESSKKMAMENIRKSFTF